MQAICHGFQTGAFLANGTELVSGRAGKPTKRTERVLMCAGRASARRRAGAARTGDIERAAARGRAHATRRQGQLRGQPDAARRTRRGRLPS